PRADRIRAGAEAQTAAAVARAPIASRGGDWRAAAAGGRILRPVVARARRTTPGARLGERICDQPLAASSPLPLPPLRTHRAFPRTDGSPPRPRTIRAAGAARPPTLGPSPVGRIRPAPTGCRPSAFATHSRSWNP